MNDASSNSKMLLPDFDLIKKIYTCFEYYLEGHANPICIPKKFSRDQVAKLIKTYPSKTQIWSFAIDLAIMSNDFKYARSLATQYQALGGLPGDLGNSLIRLDIAENSVPLLTLELASSPDLEFAESRLKSLLENEENYQEVLGALKYVSEETLLASNMHFGLRGIFDQLVESADWGQIESLSLKKIWINESTKTFSLSKLGTSKAAIEMALIIDAADEEALLCLTEIYLLDKNFTLACKVNEILRGLHPSAAVDYKYIKLSMLMGDYETALLEIDRLEGENNFESSNYFELGNLSMEKGDYATAETFFHRGKKNEAIGILCCANLAGIYRGRSEWRKSLRYAKYAFNNCEPEVKDQIGNILALCYTNLKQYEKGREIARRSQGRIIMTKVDKPIFVM